MLTMRLARGPLRGRCGRHPTLRQLLVAAALAATGCGDASVAPVPPQDPIETESDPGPETESVERSRTFVAALRVEVRGDATVDWRGEADVDLMRVGRHDTEVNILSAGFRQPMVLPQDRAHRFRWAFDLLNVYRDEPGTFEIAPSGASGGGLVSHALFVWLKVRDPSVVEVTDTDEVVYLREFTRMEEGCTVVVGEAERTGSLECPALTTPDGARRVALSVTWEEQSEPAGQP